jgi:cellulose synthase/poly-beta-1,6-N-acetylglucosamine synthase-like glycosyltransferase
MLDIIIWSITFISLFIGIFWLQVSMLKDSEKKNYVYPSVSIIIPCWNTGNGVWKTLFSISQLDYPKNRIQIIVVNHGSTDNTEELIKKFINSHKELNIQLVLKERAPGHLKAHAFNEGLKFATSEYVACIDADTIVMKDSLKEMMYLFDKDVGAVISIIKVSQPKNIYEKIQHIEYIFSSFIRLLMSRIDTLQTSHGALSVYKKSFFDKHGGFDEDNLTEDFEIAMRIRYHGQRVILATESFTYTYVPDSFKWFWQQRLRWFRGFIHNTIKYKDMAFNKSYGSLGWFQLPLNILSIIIVLVTFSLMVYNFSDKIILWFSKIFEIGLDYFKGWEWPPIYNSILNLNYTLYFPIIVSLIVGFLLYIYAYKQMRESWKYPFAIFIYFTVYPVFRSAQWIHAVYKEIFKTRKKW